MMDDIFDDLIMVGVVVVHLDNIMIFTETLEEHRTVTKSYGAAPKTQPLPYTQKV